jgi:hypothetical protein
VGAENVGNKSASPRSIPDEALETGARDRARTGDPHVGKEMLELISLRFFD